MDRRVLFLVCVIGAADAAAAIYQWTDSTGTVQFSDRPPADQTGMIERRDLETTTVTPAAPPQVRQPDRSAKSGRKHKSSKAAGDEAQERHRKRCETLRERIAKTRSKQRAGYSAKQGITLAEKLRADRAAWYRECR